VVQEEPGAVPPEFSRPRCGRFQSADPSRALDLIKFDPALERGETLTHNGRRALVYIGRKLYNIGGSNRRAREDRGDV
jgi:hypothetical protein